MPEHDTKHPSASGSELTDPIYTNLLSSVSGLLETARRNTARSVNAIMTATYWQIGKRIVEVEQGGVSRADYGTRLIERLAHDLTSRFGRGFSRRYLELMRSFYLTWQIPQTLFAESGPAFPLPWSHYTRLLAVQNENARSFYEQEALRGGWTVRQLERQINSQFYERVALSNDRIALLRSGESSDQVTRSEHPFQDPFVLEFLDLKDEYSETDLEEALIHKLEDFLLELGGDFAFVGRQRRLRVGMQWFRVDLLFFHRRLRCLVVIDLKLGEFTHSDSGQMHLYLNYAREHWTNPGENPPVGIILCSHRDAAVAHYALSGLETTIAAAEYRMALPTEQSLADEIARARRILERPPL